MNFDSSHLMGSRIEVISFYENTKLLLGISGRPKLLLYDYSTNQEVLSISNPSGASYTYRLISLTEDGSFSNLKKIQGIDLSQAFIL